MPQLLAAAVANVEDLIKRNVTELNQIRGDAGIPGLFLGEAKTFVPFGDQVQHQRPPTETLVQRRVADELTRAARLYAEMWNAAAVRDASNLLAKADVVVDGQTLFSDAPVPFLLYMEKQLEHLASMVQAMPVRDPAYRWEHDPDNEWYRTAPIATQRMEKVRKVLTLFQPTDKHPGQGQPYDADEPVGTFHLTRFSGCWDRSQQRDALDRIYRLVDALKQARAQANRIEARTDFTPAERILGYVFPAGRGVAPRLTGPEAGQ